MRDEAVLTHAIRDDPDAPSPRLVYADWLEAHGRSDDAEVHRVAAGLAEHPPLDPRSVGFRVRQVALRRRGAYRHATPSPRPGLSILRHDGVVGRSRVRSFAQLVELQDSLVQLGIRDLETAAPSDPDEARQLRPIPSLRRLWLDHASGQGRAVAACPAMQTVTHLTVLDALEPDDLRQILGAPWGRGLQTLDLERVADPGSFEALVEIELPALRELAFGGYAVDTIAGHLARWPSLATVQRLGVFGGGPVDVALDRLWASPHLLTLRDLFASTHELRDFPQHAGAGAIRLERLGLLWWGLDPERLGYVSTGIRLVKDPGRQGP